MILKYIRVFYSANDHITDVSVCVNIYIFQLNWDLLPIYSYYWFNHHRILYKDGLYTWGKDKQLTQHIVQIKALQEVK